YRLVGCDDLEVLREEQSVDLLLGQDCASVIGRDFDSEVYRCLALIRGAVMSRVVKGAIAEVEERPLSVPYLLLIRLPEILVRQIVSGVGVGHELSVAGELRVTGLSVLTRDSLGVVAALELNVMTKLVSIDGLRSEGGNVAQTRCSKSLENAVSHHDLVYHPE